MGRISDLDILLRDSLVTLSKQEFIKKFGKEKYDEYWRKVLDEDTRSEEEPHDSKYLKQLRQASNAINTLREDSAFSLLSSYEINEVLKKHQEKMEAQIKEIGLHLTHYI